MQTNNKHIKKTKKIKTLNGEKISKRYYDMQIASRSRALEIRGLMTNIPFKTGISVTLSMKDFLKQNFCLPAYWIPPRKS